MKTKTILASVLFALPLFTVAQNASLDGEAAFTYDALTYEVPQNIAAEHQSAYAEGIAFYNRGVYSLQAVGLEKASQNDLQKVKNDCVEKFERAKSSLEKCHEWYPEDKTIISALSGVYFALNDLESHQKMQARLQPKK